jgi:hypothetical protein
MIKEEFIIPVEKGKFEEFVKTSERRRFKIAVEEPGKTVYWRQDADGSFSRLGTVCIKRGC